jgi:hypothetical protein
VGRLWFRRGGDPNSGWIPGPGKGAHHTQVGALHIRKLTILKWELIIPKWEHILNRLELIILR